MIIKKIFILPIFLLFTGQHLYSKSLGEQFNQAGYVEICDKKDGSEAFDFLYIKFDELIDFLQKNPSWRQKIYSAKERFIRSKEKNLYCTDFFGFYDESEKGQRSQISFYYSTHFHEFIFSHYPEFNHVPEIICFFQTCLKIQKTYEDLFYEAISEFCLETIFPSKYQPPPILFKVIKYLPPYVATRPHYDGTAFSLFLDSTDNQSLLLSPYKTSFMSDDFFSPLRKFAREHSILLIPGAHLTEFSIYPTPHIVTQSGKTRYATIAFAMRPNYTTQKIILSPLPSFQY